MAFKKARHPKQGPKKRNKIQVLFWFDPPMAASLKKLATRHGVSQGELARAAFEHMEQHKLWDSLAGSIAKAKERAAVNRAAAAASEAA